MARRSLTLVLPPLLLAACGASTPTGTATALPPTPTEEPAVMTAPDFEHIKTIDGGELPFDAPYGVDTSSEGLVYVFDTKNQRVRVFDNAGEPRGGWGEPGTGPGQFNSLGFGSLALD
ncbi:MAG: hypothetical protein E4G99_10620, partial [Anaerolineales bacterium]